MKFYKNDSKVSIGWTLFFISLSIIAINLKGTGNLLYDKIRFLCALIAMVLLPFYSFAHTIKIDDEGISNLHMLGGWVFKVHQHIKWVDIIEVSSNGSFIGILPKKEPGQLMRNSDVIILTSNIKGYKDLLKEIITYAKNAKISDAVKAQAM